MRITIVIFGILLILAGLSLVVDPDIIYDFLIGKEDKLWLYIIALSVRLLLGAFLIISASKSKYPIAIRVFGIIFIVAAVIIIFIGHENFQDLISTLIPELRPLGRIGGLLSMALGGFFVYAFTGGKKSPVNTDLG